MLFLDFKMYFYRFIFCCYFCVLLSFNTSFHFAFVVGIVLSFHPQYFFHYFISVERPSDLSLLLTHASDDFLGLSI